MTGHSEKTVFISRTSLKVATSAHLSQTRLSYQKSIARKTKLKISIHLVVAKNHGVIAMEGEPCLSWLNSNPACALIWAKNS